MFNLDLSSATIADVVVTVFPSQNLFYLEFASTIAIDQQKQIRSSLKSQGLEWGGERFAADWLVPRTLDYIQCVEKVCLWLESQGFQVARKVIGKSALVQSFVLM